MVVVTVACSRAAVIDIVPTMLELDNKPVELRASGEIAVARTVYGVVEGDGTVRDQSGALALRLRADGAVLWSAGANSSLEPSGAIIDSEGTFRNDNGTAWVRPDGELVYRHSATGTTEVMGRMEGPEAGRRAAMLAVVLLLLTSSG